MRPRQPCSHLNLDQPLTVKSKVSPIAKTLGIGVIS